MCNKLGLNKAYFCGQDCLKSSWESHKKLHLQRPLTMGGGAAETALEVTAFSPGAFVRIFGLVRKPELNGLLGMIMAEATGRWEVQVVVDGGDPQTWALKPTNMAPAQDTDWAVLEFVDDDDDDDSKGPRRCSLLELIRSTDLGDLEHCVTFAQALFDEVSGGNGDELGPGEFTEPELLLDMRPSSSPRNGDPGGSGGGGVVVDWRKEMLGPDEGRHKLYWLALDAACLHFCLENRGNQWRLLQSSVRSNVEIGYSAREWCTPAGGEGGMPKRNESHARYGGGRTLSNEQVAVFLSAIEELQVLLDEALGQELVGQVLEKLDLLPGKVDQPPFEDPGDGSVILNILSLGEGVLASSLPDETKARVVEWATDMTKRIETEGVEVVGKGRGFDGRGTDPSDGLRFTNATTKEHILDVGPSRATHMEVLFRGLTGEPLNPAVFLQMMRHMDWREGKGQTKKPCGFTIRVFDMKQSPAGDAEP